ncbi:GGDEF domain-containing protein [Actinoplanes sp. URMC 104]|uniref:GGDEF domain-containing protein n=1 Tax=Actinoplanes sp. URMC 104 TaxID=3423409 RepID=UPI003F1A0039
MRFQLRDEPGAARSVAYLMLAAAPLVFVTGIVLPDEHPLGWVVAIALVCLVMAGGGAMSYWRPARLPRLWWLVAPFATTIMIAGLNFASRDAAAGSQFFYLWPILYAANFLSNRNAGLTLALVSAGQAAVGFTVLSPGHALADWISITVAFTLTAIVVASSLRNRHDRLREVLEAQALVDPLTGVANRRSFDGSLARASHGGGPLALLTVDIDHFKSINDTWGHGAGDRALQAVAEALRTVAKRTDDVVARLGGDEFALLLRTDRDGARHAADEVRAALEAAAELPSGPPGLSIGIAVLPDHAGTAEELRAASDDALYRAKDGGRGRTAMAVTPPGRHSTGQPAEVSAAG